MPDIEYWLGRKYNILGQEAKAAQTSAGANVANAATNAANATTNARVADSGIRMDTLRARLLPQESAATRAVQEAQARYFGAQATALPIETSARVRGIDADIGLTQANTAIARRRLREFKVMPDSPPIDSGL